MLGAEGRRLSVWNNTPQACPRAGGGRSERLPGSGGKATPPFDFARGHEPVEWQMMP